MASSTTRTITTTRKLISTPTSLLPRAATLQTLFQSRSRQCDIIESTYDSHCLPTSFYTTTSTSRLPSSSSYNLQSRRIPKNNSNNQSNQVSGQKPKLDARSEAKLISLNEIKIQTNEAKETYHQFKNNNGSNDKTSEEANLLYDKWTKHEIKLSDAYSKAIKYTARLRSKDSALKSSELLEEMIGRHFDNNSSSAISSKSVFYSLEVDDRSAGGGEIITIHDDIIEKTIQSLFFDKKNGTIETNTIDHNSECDMIPTTSNIIPLPKKQDFDNILHSWASSKAKKKGLHAEILLWRMVELAISQPGYCEFPDSRMFALVIKCYAGSTYKLAQQRIELIHRYHDALALLDRVPLEVDNPYLLMHSIKSVDDFNDEKRMQNMETWLERLHNYILDNSNRLKDSEMKKRIDLTGTYIAILRGFVRIGQVEKANGIFHKIQEVANYAKLAEIDGFVSPATIDLKTNACNLLLGSCRKRVHVPIAIQLLNQMIESMENSQDGSMYGTSLPLPDDQSFAIVIANLPQMADMNAARSIGEKFMMQFEDSVKRKQIASSTNVHNAYMELLTSRYGHSADLLPMCNDVTDRMTKMAASRPGMKPDTNTWNCHLKACATNCDDVEIKQDRLASARGLFEKMKTGSKGELTDKSLQYMMKCTSNIEGSEERENEIKNLFQMASQMGFVNAEVLQLLKQNVSDQDFTKIVGSGRLANNWIKNVTSVVVRYTDFTNGGANKHARRKGKSTSDWAKKQRRKEEQIRARKQAKVERRLRKRNFMN